MAPIVGNTNMCTNSSALFTDATPGGTWSSSDNTVASVDAFGYGNAGNTPGNVTISYITAPDANGCTNVATIDVSVKTSPTIANISPDPANVCVGGTVTLTDATTGGVWTSLTPALASVNASGVVTGITSGAATIQYTITPTCGTPISVTSTVNVNDPPSATISYAGGPFCTTSSPVSVTQTGTTGGTYSASPAGLSIAADGT